MKTINMKQLVAVTLLALSATTAIQARSWRINNNVMLNPNFTDINAAMSSSEVAAGDTLYLDPGCGLTTEQIVTKQVTVIGCGYFRADAPHKLASILSDFAIKAPNTKVEGVIFSNKVLVCASEVTLERCKVSGEIWIAPIYQNSYQTAQNVTIRQCYATRVAGVSSTEKRSAYCTIENCIIMHNGAYGVIAELYCPTIRNCYLREANNASISYSHIFHDISNATAVNNIYLNVSKASQIWDSSNADLNQNNISSSVEGNTEANIFTLQGADDSRYQLKDDSPAKGAAADGGDCGPFGGDYPYVIGGLPMGHPYYTKAVISPRSDNDKVKVSLQIKMQND